MLLQLIVGSIAGEVFQTGSKKKSLLFLPGGEGKEKRRNGERGGEAEGTCVMVALTQADVLEVEHLLRKREKLRCFCSISCLELWEEMTYRRSTSEGEP